VALLFVTLLVGMFVSALVFGALLRDFSQLRLIQVIQASAVATLLLNIVAMWKQEARRPRPPFAGEQASFRAALGRLQADRRARRLLLAVGLGTLGFAMQDVLLEPYGGEILGLSVSQTTGLTALFAAGMLAAFALAARRLGDGQDPHRLAGYGVLVGVFAFALVMLVSVLESSPVFAAGVVLIGFGSGLFGVGTLTAAMSLTQQGNAGLTLGAWGAVHATATGLAVAAGAGFRDIVNGLAASGFLGRAVEAGAAGYGAVYLLEVVLLFAALIVIGPLAAFSQRDHTSNDSRFGLAEFPS
jgi:BCD family chlorophyll transporter-like MFS transporter